MHIRTPKKTKVLAIALSVSIFTVNSVFLHAIEANFWKERQNKIVRLPAQFLPPSGGYLQTLKASPGTMRTALPAKGSTPLVLHIQDVHQNPEAQKNISIAIQNLINTNQVDLIALEGAFDPINLSDVRNFPHQETVQSIADHLLKENKISGPIHAAFSSAEKIPPIIGVDDSVHYKANVEAVKQSFPLKKAAKETLKTQKYPLDEDPKPNT